MDETQSQSGNLSAQAQSAPNPYIIPAAVVIAGALIAGAVFFSGGSANNAPVAGTEKNQPAKETSQPTGSTDNVREVTAEDHIKGSPSAQVKIVEYSDYECPFCKRFHNTMNQIMDKFGESGEVAWIYRHFPLDQLHPRNARIVASAAECVNEQGGNNMFWKFTDRFFELTPSDDRTDLTTVLPKIYGEIGADQSKAEACIASGKYDKHIQDDFDNAIATGGRGTPWSVVIGANGDTFPLNGAQPYAAVEQLIELVAQK